MTKGAIIYKAELQIADMDRGYYQNHALTLARHPSETEERLMIRLLAFVLYADERLTFGRGLSAQDEPALWKKDLTDAIDLWLDVGEPDERAIRRASSRAKRVVVVTYGGRTSEHWWSSQAAVLEKLRNLTVWRIAPEASRALSRLADRHMRLHCNLQDGCVSMLSGTHAAEIEPVALLRPADDGF